MPENTKPIAEGDSLGVESTTLSPETEKATERAPASGEQASDDEQAAAESGNLSEAGGR